MGRLLKLISWTSLIAAVGCSSTGGVSDVPTGSPSTASIHTDSGLGIEYPVTWHARFQTDTVYPGQSILVTSYQLGAGGNYFDARDNRPSGGAMVLIMDVLPPGGYLHDPMLVPRPADIQLGTPGSFEGLGSGYRVAFTDSGHAVIVFAAADAPDKPTVERLLNSITVPPRPTAEVSP